MIHGGIDGYSRKIMFLAASNNNRATTVLQGFLGAVQKFGLPIRVRSDKGGENVEVARYMLQHPERGAGIFFSIITLFYIRRKHCNLFLNIKHHYVFLFYRKKKFYNGTQCP